jgi:hypothetical protein
MEDRDCRWEREKRGGRLARNINVAAGLPGDESGDLSKQGGAKRGGGAEKNSPGWSGTEVRMISLESME